MLEWILLGICGGWLYWAWTRISNIEDRMKKLEKILVDVEVVSSYTALK